MYFCKFYNLNFGSEFDYGHIKGWKSKMYVTTVLDSFQDRKGINLKMINSYQVIGLYSMKYRSKKKNWAQGGDTPAPLACLSRAPLSLLSPNNIHVPSPKATKVSLFCSSFRPLLWHRLFCSLMAQFYWRCPCLRKWVQGVFNWQYKKPMAAVFLQAYGPPTKILLLSLVTNIISAISV